MRQRIETSQTRFAPCDRPALDDRGKLCSTPRHRVLVSTEEIAESCKIGGAIHGPQVRQIHVSPNRLITSIERACKSVLFSKTEPSRINRRLAICFRPEVDPRFPRLCEACASHQAENDKVASTDQSMQHPRGKMGIHALLQLKSTRAVLKIMKLHVPFASQHEVAFIDNRMHMRAPAKLAIGSSALCVDVNFGEPDAADQPERSLTVVVARIHRSDLVRRVTHDEAPVNSSRTTRRPDVIERTIISQAAITSRLFRTLTPGSMP